MPTNEYAVARTFNKLFTIQKSANAYSYDATSELVLLVQLRIKSRDGTREKPRMIFHSSQGKYSAKTENQ